MEPYVAPLPVTALAANATWTGGKQDRLASTMIRRVRAELWAPKAGTLYLDHWDKEDGSDVAAVKSWAVSAGVTMPTEWVDLTKRYFRWRFVNGGAAQNGIVAFEEKIGRPVMDVSVSAGNVTGNAETLTVNATAGGVGLATIPADATMARMSLDGGDIRIYTTGQPPTAAAGHLVTWGDQIIIRTRAELLAFRAIRTGATDGVLTVTYYK